MPWDEAIFPEVRALAPLVIADRRWLHRHPELSGKEFETAAYCADQLRRLGLEVATGLGGAGVIAIIHGSLPGNTVLYRADMDALPVEEQNDAEYRSERPGIMHACGHDAHCAIALGVARYWATRREQMRGTLKIVLQPNEEMDGGAAAMIADGVLENPAVQYALGLHVDSKLPAGTIALSAGPIYASCHDFALELYCKGGHAAHPEETVDSILLAARYVTAAQAIISRGIPACEPAILSFGMIHGGTKENIIPDRVYLSGTIRAFDNAVIQTIEAKMTRLAEGIVRSEGADFKLSFDPGFPPLVNDPTITALLRECVRRYLPPESIHAFRSLGAEDMGVFLQHVPGCFFQLGVRDTARPERGPHHSATFDIDESALVLGLQLAVDAIATLGSHQEKPQPE